MNFCLCVLWCYRHVLQPRVRPCRWRRMPRFRRFGVGCSFTYALTHFLIPLFCHQWFLCVCVFRAGLEPPFFTDEHTPDLEVWINLPLPWIDKFMYEDRGLRIQKKGKTSSQVDQTRWDFRLFFCFLRWKWWTMCSLLSPCLHTMHSVCMLSTISHQNPERLLLLFLRSQTSVLVHIVNPYRTPYEHLKTPVAKLWPTCDVRVLLCRNPWWATRPPAPAIVRLSR